MRVLVTGANGFLGSHLVRRLLDRGHGVRALVRPGGSVAAVDSRAELAAGDVTDAAALRRAVAGCDLVYHLAGVRRAPDRATFHRVNAESTQLLLEACVAAGAASHRFVLAGSLAAVGPSKDGKRETDPLAPVEWYGESKAAAERAAFAFSGQLPVAVGRPPRVVGPGDRENLFFFRMVAAGVVARILGPPRPLSWIDVDDCADGFVLLGERPEAKGEAFFLASRERTSVEGLQLAAARALGVAPRRLPVPPPLLLGLAWAADALGSTTGRKLPLNRKLARQLLAPGWTCTTEKAEDLLGFVARTPLDDSVARSAAFYLDHGWLPAPAGVGRSRRRAL